MPEAYQFLLDRGNLGRQKGTDVVKTHCGDHIWSRHRRPGLFSNLELQIWSKKEQHLPDSHQGFIQNEEKMGSLGLGTLPTLLICWEHFKPITVGG